MKKPTNLKISVTGGRKAIDALYGAYEEGFLKSRTPIVFAEFREKEEQHALALFGEDPLNAPRVYGPGYLLEIPVRAAARLTLHYESGTRHFDVSLKAIGLHTTLDDFFHHQLRIALPDERHTVTHTKRLVGTKRAYSSAEPSRFVRLAKLSRTAGQPVFSPHRIYIGEDALERLAFLFRDEIATKTGSTVAYPQKVNL